MKRQNLIIAGVVVGIPVLALAWWLGSPLFLNTEISEEFPMSAGAIVPDDMTASQVEAEMVAAAGEPDAQASDDMPSEGSPVARMSGEFEDFDNSHSGSGTATIYQLNDGSHVLRLKSLEVTNGPELHVLLVPNDNPAGREDITGYVDLGKLKGNIGDQNYPIPDDVDPTGFGSVVIYCVPFHVIFSVAGLS